MNKITSHIILHVERAASDLRRGQPVVMKRHEESLLVTAGEYLEGSEYIVDNSHPAVKLMKISGLLPKAVVEKIHKDLPGDFLCVTDEEVDKYPMELASSLQMISKANVPLNGAENASIIAFRPRFGHQEHLAVIIGEPDKDDAPYVRLHSSCITGDVLGSLRCDCGNQLQKSLEIISARGNGIILYLSQEGRGISIANKLRAYELQDGGMDTVEANEALGFLADERDFALAAQMLKQLGIDRIVLMTNNPEKIKALMAHDIKVLRREPIITEINVHNHRYLDTKASRLGHHLKD